MFCKGGVIIDPLAVDVKQYGEAKRRRSGLGLQIPPSNPGYKLMTRWGWQEGQGLGANLQGRTEPRLPTYQPRGDDKQGLGELRYKGMLQGDAAADQLRVCLLALAPCLCMFELVRMTSVSVSSFAIRYLSTTDHSFHIVHRRA